MWRQLYYLYRAISHSGNQSTNESTLIKQFVQDLFTTSWTCTYNIKNSKLYKVRKVFGSIYKINLKFFQFHLDKLLFFLICGITALPILSWLNFVKNGWCSTSPKVILSNGSYSNILNIRSKRALWSGSSDWRYFCKIENNCIMSMKV